MGPEAFWLEIAPVGADSALVIYPKKLMPNWQELKASIVFECADFQETYAGMVARGVKFLEEPKAMQWGTFGAKQKAAGQVLSGRLHFLLKRRSGCERR